MEPFSTSVFKSLIWILATSTKICTRVCFSQVHTWHALQTPRPPTHSGKQLARMAEYKSTALAPSIFRASSFGRWVVTQKLVITRLLDSLQNLIFNSSRLQVIFGPYKIQLPSPHAAPPSWTTLRTMRDSITAEAVTFLSVLFYKILWFKCYWSSLDSDLEAFNHYLANLALRHWFFNQSYYHWFDLMVPLVLD